MLTRLGPIRLLTTTLLALAGAGAALADDDPAAAAAAKLGEAYAEASPAERLAMAAVARRDGALKSQEARAVVNAVTDAHVIAGETAEDRLRLLGSLRADAEARLDAINEERREADQRTASLVEPDSDTQVALAMDYVASVAGAQPSLEDLHCLALVREATAWSAHFRYVTGVFLEGLNRHPPYREADIDGKLAIIRTCVQDHEMVGSQERKYAEDALLAEWLAAQRAAGASVADMRAQLEQWKKADEVCFFSASFADGYLERLEELDALRSE